MRMLNSSPESAQICQKEHNFWESSPGMSNRKTDTSVFSIFSPTCADSDASPSDVAQIAPKLNAQTLFAFGVSTAFSIFL